MQLVFHRINARGLDPFGVFVSFVLSTSGFLLPAFLRSSAMVISRAMKLLAAAGAIR